MALTKTTARRAGFEHIEDLMADFRRLSLESSVVWSDSDVTLTQLRAMAMIHLRQPMAVGVLASSMSMSLASASALADRLVRLGLVQRNRDARDRRLVLLQLDPKAVRLMGKIESRSRMQMRTALGRMRPHERAALVTSLEAFIRILGESPARRSTA